MDLKRLSSNDKEEANFFLLVKKITEAEEVCGKGWNLEDNPSGSCCCNCKCQTIITKHPWNKQEQFKGSVMEVIGFGCSPPDLFPNTTFFEKSHGMCECHSR